MQKQAQEGILAQELGKVDRLVSWDEVELAVSEMARHARRIVENPQGIVAIARGGLVPAAMLAHKLGIRNVSSILLSSYGDDRQRTDITVRGAVACQGEGTIIVDDIVDSGETLRLIQKLFPGAFTASIFCRCSSPVRPHIAVNFVPDYHWIVFPWEQTDA